MKPIGSPGTNNDDSGSSTVRTLRANWVTDEELSLERYTNVLSTIQTLINQVEVIYLSIDLDVLPLSIMSAVSAPAPVGVALEVVLRLISLIAQSGKLIWKRDLAARVTTSVAVQGHDLYVGTAKRHLYRLDTGSGEMLSEFAAESEPRWSLLIAGDSLIAFLGDEVLASLDLSLKKMRWSAEASKEWTSARPYLWRGAVLAGNRRELMAFRSSDGAREWSHQFPETVRGIGTSDEVLYVGTLKGPIFAYAPKP